MGEANEVKTAMTVFRAVNRKEKAVILRGFGVPQPLHGGR